MFPTKGLFRNVFFQPYNDQGSARIQNSAKDSKHLVQRLCLENTLEIHDDGITSVDWNDTGSLLLTAGDYKRIVITNPFIKKTIVDYETKHKSIILCAKFLPTTNNRIISCAEDGLILNLDLNRLKDTEKNFFACHCSVPFLETIPGEPNTFLSFSHDPTIFQFDLRIPNHCFEENCKKHVLIDCGEEVSDIAINPIRTHQLAIATKDGIVRIVDRRQIIAQNPANKIVPECIFTVPRVPNIQLNYCLHSISSLSYSPDGREMLVSCVNNILYLFSIDNALANDFLENTPKPSPHKRIRLSGNLENTGPLSRPSADSETRTQYAVMAPMSDTLVEINDVPNNVDVIGRAINSVFSDNDVNIINENLASNDIDQFTSNSNNQRVEFKTSNRSPGFDDIVAFQPIKAQYKGHQHVREATFWGNNFIMSGSNCGHVFVWDRYTSEIVMLLKENSHSYIVSLIRPHPSRPILATAGVGPCVKIWSPTHEDSMFSQPYANTIVERNFLTNEEMLREEYPLLDYTATQELWRNYQNEMSNRNNYHFGQSTVYVESSEEENSDNSTSTSDRSYVSDDEFYF